ncbi:proteinase-activated receptor 1-like [Erythrolamprus reginae]|uniref:proteinase-activated receptor 1-like n=1 Tax=Erythrolamprus reginae TaxID=121349 RepID=UPI00396CA046
MVDLTRLLRDSSDQTIVSSKRWPTLINSTNGNLSDNNPKERSPIFFLGDLEKYFTNQWLTQFLPAFEALAFVLGLPLNGLAIHIFVTKTKLWKPAMVYMVNLAFSDLLMLSVLPLRIAYFFSGHNWVFGTMMCHLVAFIIFCNMYCSVLLMTGISVDRFLAFVCPMKSLPWRTVRRASVACFAIWLLAIVGASPLLVYDITLWIPQMNITSCFDAQTFSVSVEFYSYYLFALSIFFFFIPLLVTTACYICIIRQLLMSRFMVQPGRKRRAIFLTGVVLCTFFFCFGPANILLLMQLFFPSQQLQSIIFVYMLSLSLSAFNCCLDPLIYYYASSECQKQIWSVLCPGKLLLLNGTKYASCSMKCNLFLRCKKLWPVVTNPLDITAWDATDDEDAKKIADLKWDDEKAISIIGLTLNDQQLIHICGEEFAARCWDI